MTPDMTMPVMRSALLPDGLRVVWAVVLCGVVVCHVAHLSAMDGRHRWWHAGHTAMAAGMLVMYAVPRPPGSVAYRVGLGLFAALTTVLAVVTVVSWSRRDQRLPWLLLTVDMLVMTYMLLPVTARGHTVGHVLAAYLGLRCLAWAFGWWHRHGLRRAAGTPASDGHREWRAAMSAPSVRASLAVMAAGMAYMLAAM